MEAVRPESGERQGPSIEGPPVSLSSGELVSDMEATASATARERGATAARPVARQEAQGSERQAARQAARHHMTATERLRFICDECREVCEPAADALRVMPFSAPSITVCGPGRNSPCATHYIDENAARRGHISWRRLTPQAKESRK